MSCTKADIAKELFLNGYNCCQATLCVFCNEIGIDEKTALKIASSFGGGMGKLEEVCGAVSGIFMAAGMKYGYTNPKCMEEKKRHYDLIRKMAEEFKQKHGTIICRELKAQSPNNGHRVSCAQLVKDATEIFEKVLNENN